MSRNPAFNTMKLSVRNFPIVFIAGLTSIILLSLLVVSRNEFLSEPELFSFALTGDITFGIPILFYFFVIRKYDLSLIFIVPAVIGSVILASFLIPESHHYYLDFIKQGLIICELALITYGIIKISKIIREFRRITSISFDLIEKLEKSFNNIIGSSFAAKIIVSEISMFYYAFFFWKAQKEFSVDLPYFTYYKKSSYIHLWSIILFILFVETFAIHTLISGWSAALSFVFLGLSIYTFLFLIADLVSAVKRPIIVSEGFMNLRTGLRWRALIPIAQIESVERCRNKAHDKNILNASLGGEINTIITFKEKIEFKGIYGIRKKVNKILLFIDDPERFTKLIMDNK